MVEGPRRLCLGPQTPNPGTPELTIIEASLLIRAADIQIGKAFAEPGRAKASLSSNHGPPLRLSEAELPVVTPPEIIGVRGADGQRGLDLRDGEYERVYSLPDQWTSTRA